MVRHAERAWQRRQIEEVLSEGNVGPQPTKMAKMMSQNPDSRWKKLRDGFDAVFESDSEGERKSFSRKEFMNLYSDVYNFYCKAVVGPRPELLSGEFACASTAGLNLYDRIESYLQNHLKKIGNEGAKVSSEGIFQFYAEQCDKFYLSSSVLNSLCASLNRRMIIPARKNGAKLLEIYDLALHSWKNTLFRTMHEQVTTGVLAVIDKERHGEVVVVNTGYIKAVSSSYVQLGALGGNEENNLDVYKRCFENRFLRETEDFYTRVSPEFIDNNYISEYTKKVEQWMQEEANRVHRFLHKSTLPKVISICGKILIERHFERLKTNFVALLPAVKTDDKEVIVADLRRTFGLTSKFETHIVILAQEFQTFLFELGLADLGLVQNDAIKSVKAMLLLYNNYGDLVHDAFQSNIKFVQALDKAFIAFMNTNPATKIRSKCPQYLARYLDQLLKPNNKGTEEQIEKNINDVVTLFRYIEDKDVFQQYYRNALSARLLLDRSSGDEMENFVLNKLEATCGNDYTNRLRRMLLDIAGSQGINQEFKTYLEEKDVVLSHDFYVKVLAIGSWPKMPQQSFTLPPEMERDLNEFAIFYNGKHNGKKLIWSLQNSAGELKYQTPKKVPYTFGASAHQMAILLLFTHIDAHHTVGEIEEATKLDFEILKQTLGILLSHKILLRMDGEENEILTRESELKIFKDINSNWKRRQNINLPLKTEVKIGEAEAQSDIDKNRRIVIQATIVRIMKTRKALNHEKLIAEVIDQLKNKFSPEVRMIRDCIGTMIEKEYLARDENDRHSYTYMA